MTGPLFAKHFLDAYREDAGNPRYPNAIRVTFLAYGSHRANGHANFKHREIANVLGAFDEEGTFVPADRYAVNRAIRTAVAWGLLEEGSKALCLIVPGHRILGHKGDVGEVCKRHRRPRNVAGKRNTSTPNVAVRRDVSPSNVAGSRNVSRSAPFSSSSTGPSGPVTPSSKPAEPATPAEPAAGVTVVTDVTATGPDGREVCSVCSDPLDHASVLTASTVCTGCELREVTR